MGSQVFRIEGTGSFGLCSTSRAPKFCVTSGVAAFDSRMIRPTSTRILGVVYAVDGGARIEDDLTMLSALLVEHAGARHVEVWHAR